MFVIVLAIFGYGSSSLFHLCFEKQHLKTNFFPRFAILADIEGMLRKQVLSGLQCCFSLEADVLVLA